MKIGGGSPVNQKGTTMPVAVPYRTGDVVVVQVQSVVGASGDFIMKFPNGEMIATVLDGFSGREGDFITVRVQGGNENRIYAELVRNNDVLRVNNNHIAFLLSRINIANTQINYQIASNMIRYGIVFDRDSFEKFLKHTQLHTELPFEQIAFMLKNDIDFTQQNISLTTSLMRHDVILGDELLLLFSFILENDKKNDGLKKLLKGFYNNPADESFEFEQLKNSNTVKNLIELIRYMKSHSNYNEQTFENLNAFLSRLLNQYEIVKKMQYVMSYLQIPINLNGFHNVAEFCMLKGEKKTKRSVYLRVPTTAMRTLGFFLSFDSDNKIECHISCEEERFISHIKGNIMMLYGFLNSIGFRLIKVTYNQIPPDISIHNLHIYADFISGQKGFDKKM